MTIRPIERIGFSAALELQLEALDKCYATGEETLFLLEHDPVYTIGRLPDKSSLGGVQRLPYPVHEINRGGQATYHGPGQLIGYPVIDLRKRGRDLHRFLRTLEHAVIRLVEAFQVPARREEGKTGVWVEDRKIASIGVGVRRWITMHGFALNVSSDLTGFQYITPCGLTGVRMTSLSLETETEVSMHAVLELAAEIIPEELACIAPISQNLGAMQASLKEND
jgi:lipoyl(octanoyl) transferase